MLVRVINFSIFSNCSYPSGLPSVIILTVSFLEPLSPTLSFLITLRFFSLHFLCYFLEAPIIYCPYYFISRGLFPSNLFLAQKLGKLVRFQVLESFVSLFFEMESKCFCKVHQTFHGHQTFPFLPYSLLTSDSLILSTPILRYSYRRILVVF